jgi:hypothetical protein
MEKELLLPAFDLTDRVAVAPGYFATPLTAAPLADPEVYKRIVEFTPLGGWAAPQISRALWCFLPLKRQILSRGKPWVSTAGERSSEPSLKPGFPDPSGRYAVPKASTCKKNVTGVCKRR